MNISPLKRTREEEAYISASQEPKRKKFKPDSLKRSQSAQDFSLDKRVCSLVNTNLTLNRPAWVSQSCISQSGMLSAENFLYSNDKREERLFWFFSQRKFPQAGKNDTIRISEEIKDPFFKPEKDGFAVSLSHHSHQTIYFVDRHIKRIECCWQIDWKSDIPVGIYADGKVMIQQQATRGCLAACAAMILADHGKSWKDVPLSSNNRADDKELLNWLKQGGVSGKVASAPKIGKVQKLIQAHGSLCLKIYSGEIGSHEIIVDYIDWEIAKIRDPFHGWRITVATQKLARVVNSLTTAIYVKG